MQEQNKPHHGRRPTAVPPSHPTTFSLEALDKARKLIAGIVLVIALGAFELFNFDTTRYALQNLLGEVRFLNIHWATILAIAFCAIDFAGLTRLFTPQQGKEEPTAVWYLMGAWLIGATMNAVTTWWAISLTLLSHDLGNELLSREQLLRWVPFFMAALVWLTRILFIGAISVAGEYLFDFAHLGPAKTAVTPTPQPSKPTRPLAQPRSGSHPPAQPRPAMSAQPKEPSRPSNGPPRPSAMHTRPRR